MEIRFIDVKAGKRHVRSLPCAVGRGDDVGFRVKNDSVSRRHCEFTCVDDTVRVTDLGSTNGTFVGGARLDPHVATAVPTGAKVRLGGIVLRVEYTAARVVAGLHEADTVPLADAEVPELEPVAEALPELEPVADALPELEAVEPEPPVAAPEIEVAVQTDVAGFPAAAPAQPATDLAGLDVADPAPATDGSFDFLGAEAAPPESDDKLDDFFKSIS